MLLILRLWAGNLFPPYQLAALLPYMLLPIAAGLLLVSILPLHRTVIGYVLSLTPIVWVGRLSYALYLVHLFALYQLGAPSASTFLHNLFFLAFTLGLVLK